MQQVAATKAKLVAQGELISAAARGLAGYSSWLQQGRRSEETSESPLRKEIPRNYPREEEFPRTFSVTAKVTGSHSVTPPLLPKMITQTSKVMLARQTTRAWNANPLAVRFDAM